MSKKILLISGGIIFFLGALWVGFLFKCEDDWCYLFDWQKARSINSFEACAAQGNPIMESYPRQCRANGKTFVEKIATQETPEYQPNIVVFSPIPNEEIGLPLIIEGEARVFESSFLYRLKDARGAILVYNHDMANAQDMGLFGPFSVRASYPEPSSDTGTLEVFSGSPKDGSEINKVTIPVRFKKVDTLKIKVFFSSREKDPDSLNCDKTYPIERRILKTKETARAALLELLYGATIDENELGYFTSINSGVKLKSLKVSNGVAYADFDELLGVAVAGSCRVLAIRSQIFETLKQFSSIKDVVISINGKTEGILEP